MPVKTEEVNYLEIIKKAAFPTLLPLGIAGLGWYVYLNNKEQTEWFKKLKKPRCASLLHDNPCLQLSLEVAFIAPIGYAAHVVCKQGVGNDRQLALGLYGAGLLVLAAGIPAFVKTKDLKCWAGVELLAAGAFGAAAGAFYKVNKTSGLLLAPLVVLLTYQGITFLAIMKANSPSEPVLPKQK